MADRCGWLLAGGAPCPNDSWNQGLCREHYTADLERYRGYAASLRAENAALRARLALADRLAEAIEAPGIVARPMVVRVTYSHWKDIEQAARDYRASAGK